MGVCDTAVDSMPLSTMGCAEMHRCCADFCSASTSFGGVFQACEDAVFFTRVLCCVQTAF